MREASKKKELLTRAQEQELFQRFHAGDMSAREELIMANLALVGSLTNKYAGLSWLEPRDLYQEGVIGLENAIDAYDPDSKNKLSTVATVSIVRQMKRATDNAGKGFRIPAYQQERIRKIRMALDTCDVQGLEPTVERLSDLTGLDEAEVESAQKAMKITSASMNTKVKGSDGETTEMGTLIENKRAADPAKIAMQHELQNALTVELTKLGETDRYIIASHYGLNGVQKTLTEIGNELGITHEAVRIREAKAFKKLRETKLADFA